MTHRNTPASPLTALILVALAACSVEAPSDPGDADEIDDSGSADSDAEETFSVSGSVEDLSGSPVVDLYVTVSTEYCIPDRTDTDGRFSVEQVSLGQKRLITYGETVEGGAYASVVFAFEAEGETTLSEPVLAPVLTESIPLDLDASAPFVVETADGLAITIDPAALDFDPFAEHALTLARVPVERAPPFVPDGVTLLDLFVLHPILSTFESPAPIKFPADLGLAVGTRVTFYALDYETGWLVPVAGGEVDSDGRPTTDPDEGIPELTWIGLSLETL